MAYINLLPWREQRRREQQKRFLTIAGGAAVLAAVVVLYVHIHINRLIDYQERRNDLLKEEIATLDRKIAEVKELEKTKQALLDRMNIIQELQASRPRIVHVFDALVTTLPDGLYLTSVVEQGGSLVVEGKAESNARVSAYMRNLDASAWFADPTLDVIETSEREGIRLSSFKLRVAQSSPSEEKEATAEA